MFHHRFAAMTTRCEVQLAADDHRLGAALAAAIERRVADLVAKYNFHAADSWLNRTINQRRTARVTLDAETAGILQLVRSHAQRTAGAFDITVGTLAPALRQVRSVQEVQVVKRGLAPAMGLAAWQLEGDTLHCSHPATRFDLGGVIKEYAVDEAARLVRAHGLNSGLINFGGDVFALGKKPDGQRYVAAVSHPEKPDQLLFGLDLEDQALTTSGHYARHRRLGDGLLSHVQAPGGRETSAWASVSVVSASALLSGLYSTALLIDADICLPRACFGVGVDRLGRMHTLRCEPAN